MTSYRCPKCGKPLFHVRNDPETHKAIWGCDCGGTWTVATGDLEAEEAAQVAKLDTRARRRAQGAARQARLRRRRQLAARDTNDSHSNAEEE